jgi:iron uptake system component EfeO
MPARVSAPLRMAAVAAAVALAAAGCRGTSDGTSAAGGPGTASGGPIPVKAGDSSCEVARTTLPAGTNTFAVTNTGCQVTEIYVYGPGDRIMGEVENIGPALTRQLTVELPAGSYQTSCKPGQTGQGIRGPLTVSGSAPAQTEDVRPTGE